MTDENYLQNIQEAPQMLFCAREKNLKPGASFGPIIRDIYLIECCTGGRGSVEINGVEYPFSGGDCYALFPGDVVTHRTDVSDPRTGISCVANGALLRQVLSLAGITSKNPFVSPSAFQEILQEMENAIELENHSDPGVEFKKTACLYRILAAIVKDATVNNRDTLIQKAVGMMEARYHEPLTISEIADFVGLERTYFSSLFKEETGLAPYHYLNRLRIRKACLLLKERRASVATVSESVGVDPQNFARMFKREVGMTPMQYKKKEEETRLFGLKKEML